jgi:hypothetical protein
MTRPLTNSLAKLLVTPVEAVAVGPGRDIATAEEAIVVALRHPDDEVQFLPMGREGAERLVRLVSGALRAPGEPQASKTKRGVVALPRPVASRRRPSGGA